MGKDLAKLVLTALALIVLIVAGIAVGILAKTWCDSRHKIGTGEVVLAGFKADV
mgnify:CR=1 FL=1